MEQQIRKFLGNPSRIGRELLCFGELDSTNTRAKELALKGAEDGTAVIADFQTAGRGRMDRTFHSPKGRGIYLSVLLRPKVPMEQLACITPLAGVAVCDAVERVCGVRPGLKWPNDPVLGNRKLCGILTELVIMPDGTPAVVLGIGLNVSQEEESFPPELRQMATSLVIELGGPVSREKLIAELLRRLEPACEALEQGRLEPWVERYRKDCVHLGKSIWLIGPTSRETVTALDVDEAFGLIIRDETGRVRSVRAGEISVRGLFGYTD